MNGRLYDPVLGRMLSPDNYAHAGSQGANRYSYVLNNPLKYTDPDGENPLGLLGLFTVGEGAAAAGATLTTVPTAVSGATEVLLYGSEAAAEAAADVTYYVDGAAGGASAIASAIPFVAAAVAIYLYLNDCAHNVQQANTANNYAVQHVEVGQSGTSSYRSSAPYTPRETTTMVFDPRASTHGGLCSDNGSEDDLFNPKPKPKPSRWKTVIAQNHTKFYDALQEGLKSKSEKGYRVLEDLTITKEGVDEKSLSVAFPGLTDSDKAKFHTHPDPDDPYSSGDFGSMFKLLDDNRVQEGDFDIAYTTEYIYVIEVVDATKAKEFYHKKAARKDSEGTTYYNMGDALNTKSYEYNGTDVQVKTRQLYHDFFKDAGIRIYSAPTTSTLPTNFTLLNP